MIQARSVRTSFGRRGCVHQAFNHPLASENSPILRTSPAKLLQEAKLPTIDSLGYEQYVPFGRPDCPHRQHQHATEDQRTCRHKPTALKRHSERAHQRLRYRNSTRCGIVLWCLKFRNHHMRNKNSSTSSSSAGCKTNLNTCATSPET